MVGKMKETNDLEADRKKVHGKRKLGRNIVFCFVKARFSY